MRPHPNHPLARYPPWLTRWIGYRATIPPKRPDYIIWFWSFIGAFSGLCILQAVFGHAGYFVDRGVPSMIASYVSRIQLLRPACHPLVLTHILIGCVRRPLLWRHRSSTSTTPRTRWRALHRRRSRALHHEAILAQPALRVHPVARRLALHLRRHRRHADDRHDAPSRGSDRTSPRARRRRLGPQLVLPPGRAPVKHARACERPAREQRPASIPYVLVLACRAGCRKSVGRLGRTRGTTGRCSECVVIKVHIAVRARQRREGEHGSQFCISLATVRAYCIILRTLSDLCSHWSQHPHCSTTVQSMAH